MNINLAKIDFCPGGGSAELQEKSVSYTANGSYSVTPDSGYDGMSKTNVSVNVQPTLQAKTSEMLLSETTKTISPDSGYDGLSSVTVTHAPVEANTTETITTNGTHIIIPGDGYDATMQVTATVNVQPTITLQDKTATPSTSQQSITADSGYDGLGTVSVNAVTSSIDANIQAGNIKKDVSILGVTGTFEGGGGAADISNTKFANSTFSTFPTWLENADWNSVTNADSMFSRCTSLTTIPLIDTSSVTSAEYMFNYCTSLTTIPLIDTSSVVYANYMFYNCSSLSSIPLIDTGSVTSASSMFSYCTSLTTIPELDTGSVTSANYMFSGCTSLTTIPRLNISNATSMNYMFNGCNNLEEISELDTSNATNMQNMFYGCGHLRRIRLLNVSSVTNPNYLNYMFRGCSVLENITFEGSINVNLDISACTYLDYDSVKSILTAASNTTNINSKSLKFSITITDQGGELASLVSTCTTKGWTITGLTIN